MSKLIRESVGLALLEVAKAHRTRVATGLAALDLHIGQELLLVQLWHSNGLSQTELTERLSVEPPTIAKMVVRMEKAGLVARRKDPRDARSRLVTVTPRGAALQHKVERLWSEVERALTGGMSKRDAEEARALLARMKANLD